MKWHLGVVVLLVFIGGSTVNALPKKALNFMGEYSQKTGINFTGAEDKTTCLSEVSDDDWTSNLCFERTINKVIISKVSDLKDTYFAQISIIGGNIHTCDFSGEMILKANKLVYEDVIPDEKDICKIEIDSVGNGIKVSAGDTCNQYYCGFGLTLSGTNQAFERTSSGQEISHLTAVKRERE